MGSKECDFRKDLGIGKDSSFKVIHNEEGSLVGIATSDASLDYSQNGQNFLRSEVTKDIKPSHNHRNEII